MRTILFAAVLGASLMSACQAQSQGAPDGWRTGPYLGPMMSYGYCPGYARGSRGPSQGWYGPGMMGGHMMGGGMMGSGAWLDQARTELGVTQAQEQAWSAYVEAVEADRGAMLAMHSQMSAQMAPGANAPDRLQAHIDMMSTRLTSLQQIETATRALYQVLTPEQRERADRTLWSGCW